MKQLAFSLTIVVFSLSILIGQTPEQSSMLLISNDTLKYLKSLEKSTYLFLNMRTNNTVRIVADGSDFSQDQLFTIGELNGEEITLINDANESFDVNLLPAILNEAKETKGIVYEKNLNIDGVSYLYRLKKDSNYFYIELCKTINNKDKLSLKCQMSVTPLVGDYPCNHGFNSVFAETIQALNYDTKDTSTSNGLNPRQKQVIDYFKTSAGKDRLSDLCKEGKKKYRDRVKEKELAQANKDIQTIKDDYSKKLANLERENAGIMTMKKRVQVVACKKLKTEKYLKNQKEIKEIKTKLNSNSTKDDTKKSDEYAQWEAKLKELENECFDCYKDCCLKNCNTESLTFIPKKLWFKTDFYRVSDIRLDGVILHKEKEYPISVINRKYGFNIDGIIGVNNPTFSITKRNVKIDNELYDLKFYIGEIIDYQPKDGVWSKFFANAEYEIVSPNTNVVVKKRNINDFISATIFTDAFGFIGDQANSVFQTEVTAYIPLNRHNKGISNWVPEMTATFNFSFVRGLSETQRFVQPSFAQKKLEDGTIKDIGLVNPINFLRYADIDFYIRGKIHSFELKGWSSFLNVELGYRLLRSKVNVSENTEELDVQSKFIHSPIDATLSLSVRPDWLLGANIQLGYHYFTNFRTGQPDAIEVNIKDDEKSIIRNEVNIYGFITSERKSGLFFRYRGYHKLQQSKFTEQKRYFPSILIGYSTNLAALIKGRQK